MKGKYITAMLKLIAVKHDGQFDKAGEPYVRHPIRVMVRLNTNDEELECMCLGHDVLEDGGYATIEEGIADLRRHGFSERIIAGIVCVTKVPGESPEEYEAKVMSNDDSIQVKMSDLDENMDLGRLPEITEKDRRRHAKYQRFYAKLHALAVQKGLPVVLH